MVDLPLPRTGLPGLAPLLNGDLWSRWEAEGRVFRVPEFRRSVRYVRLKPGTSCRLAIFRGFDAAEPGRPPAGMLLYLFPTADRAREFYDKRSAGKLWRKPMTHDPFIDAEKAIVAFPFPNDREIPALRHVYRHHRLKELVLQYLPGFVPPGWKISRHTTRLRLIRYKAGRRAVFQYTLGARETETGERRSTMLHLKAESPESFSPSRNAFLARLRSALDSTDVVVPEILGVDTVRLLTLRPWYAGKDLAARISEREALRKSGRALAALHGVSPQLSLPSIQDPVKATVSEAEGLASLLPEERTRIMRIGFTIAGRLGRLSATNRVLLHGDFHPEQVVFHNDRVVLIDLDRCGAGHPALDLGSFLAHGAELEFDADRRDAFLDEYSVATGAAVNPGELAAGYCFGLLRRCGRPFRDLAPDWPSRVRQRIERLEQAAEGLE